MKLKVPAPAVWSKIKVAAFPTVHPPAAVENIMAAPDAGVSAVLMLMVPVEVFCMAALLVAVKVKLPKVLVPVVVKFIDPVLVF